MGLAHQVINYATLLFVLLTKKCVGGEISDEIKKATTTEVSTHKFMFTFNFERRKIDN